MEEDNPFDHAVQEMPNDHGFHPPNSLRILILILIDVYEEQDPSRKGRMNSGDTKKTRMRILIICVIVLSISCMRP